MLRKYSTSVLGLLTGCAAICSVLVSMSGCDQISGQPIVQVIGEVSMDRKPLADTMVAFIPLELRSDNGKIIELAFGSTDDAGRFELRTSEARGVLPGEYRILFFRPNSETEESPHNGGSSRKGESNGVTSDTSLMMAAIDRMGASARTIEGQSGTDNVGGIPVTYNLQSDQRLTVKPGAGIIYPKFELDAHPKN